MRLRFRTFVWVVLLLGVLILVVWGAKNNPEWHAFSWRLFLSYLVHVHPGYLLAGLGLTLSCYFIRALRWREFLFPVKKASLGNLLSAVLVGFAAVTLLGRAGEFSRPFILSKKENLPLSLSLTTVIVERLFDFSAILTLFLVNLAFFHLGTAVSPQNAAVFHFFSRASALVLAILVAVTAFLFLFQMNAVRWIDFLIERMRLVPERFVVKMEQALKSFVEGLAFIAHARPLFFSFFYSMLLWLTATAGIYCIVRGFRVPFSFSMGIVLLTFSAIGAIVQLPGVGGGYQALILFSLVSFLGVNPTVASGITLVAWVIAFLPVALIGLIELLRGGWSLTSLAREAEKEAASALAQPLPALGKHRSEA
ncbi:MAG: flippase-like domain-containing protein [Acidobacteriia bacterium]|nr:flippase-like domain-containing protein [Terriglobia bacterium]